MYFRVRSFDGYGKLSNRDPDQMDQGEEAGAAELKESPLDFALWKARKPDEDTFWASPWGEGRPGWHIECSAMAEKLLGADFEIHSGGSDLVFPHHENEIAQTEAARGLPLARLWMHNGMVRTDAEKMSKSLGNIFQLSEALDRFGGEAVVAYLTSGHYRQPLEFSEQALEEARSRVERIRNFLDEAADGDEEEDRFVAERREAFLAALADDFNTPKAWAALFELIAEGNRRPLPGRPRGARRAAAAARARIGARRRLRATNRTPRPRGCSPSARARAPSATSPAPTRSATGWARSAGRSATPPRALGCGGPDPSRATPRSSTAADRWRRRSAVAAGCAGSGPRTTPARPSSTGWRARPTIRGSSPRSIRIRTPTPAACSTSLTPSSSRSTRSRIRTTSAPSPARPRPPGSTGW